MLLEVNNITKKYKNYKVLNGVHISIPSQHIFGLLGPNGAGKTTLLRIINQTILQDSGEVILNGRRISQNDMMRIGYLPEERGLYKKMKVREQVIYLLRLKGLTRYEASRRLSYWLDKFGMREWENKKTDQLSKGMQQKIQFLVAVLHEPQLIILDEPFTGFDPINTEGILNEIRVLKEKGTTIILSTHNMNSVEKLCDKVAFLNKGKKIVEGNVEDLREKYKSNIYEIKFKGDIIEVEKLVNNRYIFTYKNIGRVNTIRVEIPNNNEGDNQLLQMLIPHIQINSFKEILPNMNDIFIKLVKN